MKDLHMAIKRVALFFCALSFALKAGAMDIGSDDDAQKGIKRPVFVAQEDDHNNKKPKQEDLASLAYPGANDYTKAVGSQEELHRLEESYTHLTRILHKEAQEQRITAFVPQAIQLITQYALYPIEHGFIREIHYAQPNILTIIEGKNPDKKKEDKEDLEKGLPFAIALRPFTKNTNTIDILTKAAFAMLKKLINVNHTPVNSSGLLMPPALHCAVLSDPTDAGAYIENAAKKDKTKTDATAPASTTTALALAPKSLIISLIATGAAKDAVDAHGYTFQHYLDQRLAKLKLLTDSPPSHYQGFASQGKTNASYEVLLPASTSPTRHLHSPTKEIFP